MTVLFLQLVILNCQQTYITMQQFIHLLTC